MNIKSKRPKITILSFAILSGVKEGFYLILGPFLPNQMRSKEIDEAYFTPIFV